MQRGEEQPQDILLRKQYANIIKQTRKIITNMTQDERFLKAQSHIIDALESKQPRPMNYSPDLTSSYYCLYLLQNNWLWSILLFVVSFVFMYMVILDKQSNVLKISFEGIFILLFIFDTFIDFYCLSFDTITIKNKYPKLSFFKAVIVAFMLVDYIVFIAGASNGDRPIRPFRILRVTLPVIYDQETRRSLIALFSAYRQTFSFILYYSIIIIGFALIGSRTITFDRNFVDPNPRWANVPYPADEYYNNYNQMGRMIYFVYGMGTWDFYPDFQLLAVQNFEPNYIFFITFIFFNMFLFAAIPGAVIYNKFRETRSRYIIFDQIKQQHSLILAFVTLAQEDLNLSMDLLVKFLFYFYRKKTRYIQYVIEICMKLDDNNNGTIQVNQFMQLSKIILYNSVMYPPKFDDCQFWIKFRQFINQRIHLQGIVQHYLFDVVVSVITLLCCVNAILLLFHDYHITRVFDSIFVWLFFVEILVRIVAVGPETYFAYRWNNIDSFLIVLNVVFFFVSTSENIENLFVISRAFRVAFLFRTLILSETVQQWENQFIFKFRRLFQTFLEIFPIITRFFILFAFFFYIFGIIGMELFYQTQKERKVLDSPYGQFAQFSNFQTFIHSQYVMIQILTEGAWAKVVYDYCFYNQHLYGPIIIFFMLMHFVIVYINGTLLKGIFWEVYFTVSSVMDQREEKLKNEAEHQKEIQEKTEEINGINQQINQNQTIEPNTVIKREIIEMKMDMDILKKIKNIQDFQEEEPPSQRQIASDRSLRSFHRSKLVSKMMENMGLSAKQFKRSRERSKKKKKSVLSPKLKRKKVMDFNDLKDKQEEDFHSEMQDLLNKLIISSKIKYSYMIAYPTIFVDFLNYKFRQVQEIVVNKFDIHSTPLQNQQSLRYHMYELAQILNVDSSERQKKQLIVECLVNNRLIDGDLAQKIIKTQLMTKNFHIDANGALKKMYLSETNADLIKKLEIQYFSDVYGHTFKQINKVRLQPLLKVEASLTYTLWNVLSYSQINHTDFFHFLTFIEDQISNKLLKPGSLFKFVYKMASESDIWFSIDRKRHQDTSIRFIKTGLWAHTPQMEENQIHYARDIFKWEFQQSASENMSMNQQKIHEQYMKLFYQSFQTLAFGLSQKHNFFESNPKEYIYDLYLDNFDVGFRRNTLNPHPQPNQLKVSNIMIVILSKQEERADIGESVLPYKVSDIKTENKKKIKEDFFLLDDDEKETFEKLKNLSAVDNQKIIESEGLPFSYIINLMKQISDLLRLHSGNFLGHIEKVLSEKYNELQNGSILSEMSSINGERQDKEEKELKDMIRILPDFDLGSD